MYDIYILYMNVIFHFIYMYIYIYIYIYIYNTASFIYLYRRTSFIHCSIFINAILTKVTSDLPWLYSLELCQIFWHFWLLYSHYNQIHSSLKTFIFRKKKTVYDLRSVRQGHWRQTKMCWWPQNYIFSKKN